MQNREGHREAWLAILLDITWSWAERRPTYVLLFLAQTKISPNFHSTVVIIIGYIATAVLCIVLGAPLISNSNRAGTFHRSHNE
jgi:hypothetical protein